LTNSTNIFKPIFKWAGGKTQLLPNLLALIPKKINKYYEPFIGGGAVFFKLCPSKYLISDSNPELINTYKTIASNPNALIEELSAMENSKEFFYKIRDIKFNEINSINAAARTIYLNRTCFNGLFRVNKKGEFNVPFGSYKNPDFIQREKILSASKILKTKKIKCMDFRGLYKINFDKDDFIFFDPPYVPLEGYADFKRYTKEQFYEDSQIELADFFSKLAKQGNKIILTNSNSTLVNKLYKNFNKIVVSSKRNINVKGDRRNGEDLIIYANI